MLCAVLEIAMIISELSFYNFKLNVISHQFSTILSLYFSGEEAYVI